MKTPRRWCMVWLHLPLGLRAVLIAGWFVAVAASAAPVLPHIAPGEKGQPITSWLLIGPFNAEPGRPAAEIDFLASLGLGENEATTERVEELLSRQSERGSAASTLFTRADGVEQIDFNKLYGRVTQFEGPQAAVYAICAVDAPKAGTLWLMLGSVDGAKIWLNGEPIHSADGRRQLKRYDDNVELRLNTGVNLLVVKVVMIDPSWAMAARLEMDENGAIQTAMATSDRVLMRRVLPVGEPLKLGIRGLPQTVLLDGQISDATGQVVRTIKLGPRQDSDLAGLAEGPFDLSVTAATGQTLSTTFVVGTLETLRPKMIERARPFRQDDRVEIGLETLLRRMEILQRPYLPPAKKDPRAEYYFNARREISTAYTVRALNEALVRLEAREEPFRHRPGLHLRGFRSRVDDEVFHYRLYVPPHYKAEGDGLALVVVMPTVFETNRPYLESVYLADPQQAEGWAEMAREAGLGILWPGYRVGPYGNPADETYMDEVLQAVAADYKLDTSRLYLYGTCSGGMMGAMEAARNAARYAAVAFINPVLRRLKHRYDDNGDYAHLPAYRSWLQATDPMERLAAVSETPIWLLHDGLDPDHGPLSQSVEFVNLARALGHPVQFLRRLPERRMEQMFAWLATHRRASPPPLSFQPQPKGGPLSRALAERFIVVRGTVGKGEADLASRHWCDRFLEAWKRLNNGPCRVVDDVDLSSDEEAQSNLVLIGNSETNLVWRRLAPKLPVEIRPEGISAGSRRWAGTALAIASWSAHPDIAGRRVVLVGASDLVKAKVGTMEFVLDGWFDLAIWNNDTAQPRLVTAEVSAEYPR